MRIETALKRRDSIREAFRSIHSRAAHFGFTHAQMLEERGKAMDRFLKGCPEWIGQYASGIWDELQHQAYARNLIHGGFVAGQFYSTHSNRSDYYWKAGIEPREFSEKNESSGHYWAMPDGSVKPFFIPATDCTKEEESNNA